MSDTNNHIVLVMGEPTKGKSTSLNFLREPERFVYLNADLKPLPFRDNFAGNVKVEDPMEIFDYIAQVEESEDVDGAIIDTLTYLMEMYETQYIHTASDTREAWGMYAQFYRELIHRIKAGTKKYIILAHENIVLNEKTAQYEAKVPVKGAVGRVGVEADFTTIVSAKEIEVHELKKIKNKLLDITEDEIEDGTKHVFVTRTNKEYSGGKMRAPIGFWERDELFIDNNIQHVLDRLDEYYN